MVAQITRMAEAYIELAALPVGRSVSVAPCADALTIPPCAEEAILKPSSRQALLQLYFTVLHSMILLLKLRHVLEIRRD